MSRFKNLHSDYFKRLSRYATKETKGRVDSMRADEFRNDFQRDTHRIIYSQAFRRLRHKTQVFYFPHNDHVTTRMDHVLFVSSAARTVARCLGLNEDLAEAVGLAHDIGHAPFGHQGEGFINKIIDGIIEKDPSFEKIMPGFFHEIYGLRVVDKLAKRDRETPGLNLTWEVRDGIISHCGEDFKNYKLEPGDKNKDLDSIKTRSQAGKPATMEGCVVRLIDKIAYAGKDIEDALEAGIIGKEQVPDVIFRELGKTNGAIIGTFLEDMIRNSYKKDFIAISEKRADLLHKMIEFNIKHIYRSEQSKKYEEQANDNVRLLFEKLLKTIRGTNRFKSAKAGDWDRYEVYKMFRKFVREDLYDNSMPDELIVLDFIAGMTDSYILYSFEELFIPKPTV